VPQPQEPSYDTPQHISQEEEPFVIELVVPGSLTAQGTPTLEQPQQQEDHKNTNNEENDDEEYSPLSDTEFERMYRDADEVESFRHEALVPTGRLRVMLVPCPGRVEFKAHQQQPPPPPQSRLGEFLRTCPTTFSQAKDPMEAENWLKSIEKKLEIAQCTDREKVLFTAHQLFGAATDWWETYRNSHQNVGAITWNEFKTRFYTHYVPRGTMKLKKMEFADLK
jgi:hypothetical protein